VVTKGDDRPGNKPFDNLKGGGKAFPIGENNLPSRTEDAIHTTTPQEKDNHKTKPTTKHHKKKKKKKSTWRTSTRKKRSEIKLVPQAVAGKSPVWPGGKGRARGGRNLAEKTVYTRTISKTLRDSRVCYKGYAASGGGRKGTQ